MTLFTPDLYRNLALGFVLGTALVAGANFDAWSDEVSSPANAAQIAQAPQPAAGFWDTSAR